MQIVILIIMGVSFLSGLAIGWTMGARQMLKEWRDHDDKKV